MGFFKTEKVYHETYLLVRSLSHFIFFLAKTQEQKKIGFEIQKVENGAEISQLREVM